MLETFRGDPDHCEGGAVGHQLTARLGMWSDEINHVAAAYRLPITFNVEREKKERQFPIKPVLKRVFIVLLLSLLSIFVVAWLLSEHVQKLGPWPE
jgi:hypothetical protein